MMKDDKARKGYLRMFGLNPAQQQMLLTSGVQLDAQDMLLLHSRAKANPPPPMKPEEEVQKLKLGRPWRKQAWRKYGQKVLKGKETAGMNVVRSYFRCSAPGCDVKKQVEKAPWQSDDVAKITITGEHNHPIEDEKTKGGVSSEDGGSGRQLEFSS